MLAFFPPLNKCNHLHLYSYDTMAFGEMTPSAESTQFRDDVTGDGSVSMFVSTNQSAGNPGTSESVKERLYSI